MPPARYVFPIDTARDECRATGAAEVRQTPEQAGERSTLPASDAETIVRELVNQYFRRSTRMSGIFLCW